MLAYMAAGALLEQLATIGPAPIAMCFLPKKDRDALLDRAKATALAHGISESCWNKWRKGRGLGRDLLMAIDPEREVARAREAQKENQKTE